MTGTEGSDEDDYCYYGTAIQDEGKEKGASHRKSIQDHATVRSLPVWQQEPTDEQGRKRFHGAFTGGFSAGFYNTVGSVVSTSL
jgi:G patch domain-containing protein 1